MKILFVVPLLKSGGAERVTTTFAKSLRDKHDISFVNIGNGNGELQKWIKPYFNIVSLNQKRTITSYFALKKQIKSLKPDFVFTSHIYVAVVLMLISITMQTKVIIRFPTMPTNKLYKGIRIKIMEILEKALFKRAYKIIAQTDAMKAEINNILKIDNDKIIVINNPIDTELINEQTYNSISPYKDSGTNYLAVGNISPAKGYDVLIKAFKEVVTNNNQAHLYILGRCEDEYSASIIEMAKDCSNIHFEGFCENPYIYMKHCNALVLSSRMEGLPNVVLEAMYFNRPIVATKCVPIIETLIHDGENGYKIEPNNPEELAIAMEKVVNLTDVKNEYSSTCIEFEKIFEQQ